MQVSPACTDNLSTQYSANFFDQMTRLLFFSLHVILWLLLKGDVYFFGKPADMLDKVHTSDTVTIVRHCQ